MPFEQKVTIEPAHTETVKVSLIAKPVELKPIVKVEEPTDSIFKRPGLYVAAGGAIVAGVEDNAMMDRLNARYDGNFLNEKSLLRAASEAAASPRLSFTTRK